MAGKNASAVLVWLRGRRVDTIADLPDFERSSLGFVLQIKALNHDCCPMVDPGPPVGPASPEPLVPVQEGRE